jgi:tetratricopeptide (TPR) repeat protein
MGLVLLEGLRGIAHPSAPDEHFVEFYFNESREAHLAGDLPVAVSGYEGVLRLNPFFAPAHHELCLIHLRGGDMDGALARCREAVRLQPEDPNFLNSLGSVLIQSGRLREALQPLEQATRLDPAFASAWYNLAGACWTLGDVPRAESALRVLDSLDASAARRLRAQFEQHP